jgi:RNA polymerase sigma factor (sigma-70 family)
MSNKVFSLLSATELLEHLDGCVQNQRESQKLIYSSFYGYAMSICDRYTNNQEDALEIMNDGFLKIFREIRQFSPAYADVVSSFKGWLRKIMIYTAIDHFRKYHKHTRHITELHEETVPIGASYNKGPEKLAVEEIIRAIQKLSPAYRTVLNLFIIEGYSHEEIARQLNISEGTSKSNLAKARMNLQRIINQQEQPIKNVI